jgi:chorismate mutase
LVRFAFVITFLHGHHALFLLYLIVYDRIIKMPSGEAKLEEIRKRIDEIDDAIVDLLAKRMEYANETKAEKLLMKQPIVDEQRQNEVIAKWCERARMKSVSGENELSEEMMTKIAKLVIEYTVKMEMEGQQ